jgi:hypothetical protein
MKLAIGPDVIIPTIEPYWDFARLCADLTHHKHNQKSLSPREKQFLAYLLLGYSPKDISQQYDRPDNSSSTRTILSTTLYPTLKKFLAQHTAETIKPGSSGRLLVILEQIGYKKAFLTTD